MKVGYASWSLDVAPGWHPRYDPECLTITPAANDAVLQLSSMVKRGGVVTDDDLQGQAFRESEQMGGASPVRFAKFRGLAVSYVSEGISWRRLWLAHENVLLFVTVNASAKRLAAYEADILRMLESLAPADVA